MSDAVPTGGAWWHGLADAVGKEVAADWACWAATTATGMREGRIAVTTAERWRQVRELR